MTLATILIVEDHDSNRALVERVLSEYGYCLLTALDGREAIEIATLEHPDLILMDMKLPRMDGYQATRMLKQQSTTADIPIVALTAQAMEGDRQKALEAGCDGYISKPIDTRAFPEQVKGFLDLTRCDGE
jgi:two-component system cell cycle response regulator DivK